MKLSVIIPVYNEEKTIGEIIRRVGMVDLEKEIIVVDDGSKDGTRLFLENMRKDGSEHVKIIFHEKNSGKGAAIRTGLGHVRGDAVIIQDADLEYDPEDYVKLLEPIKNGQSKIVYGSRNLGNNPKGMFLYRWGGIFLSFLANVLYGIRITDEATCYKVFSTDVLKGFGLRCRKFEFCPEVTAKAAKKKYKIIEVPISYAPRNKKEGKKISVRDGIMAIWILIKYRFTD